jgi:hypothetical protein
LLSVNLISWENDHAADSVADPAQGFGFFRREYDVPKRFPLFEMWDERVSGQEELAELGVVMEVHARRRVT